MRLSPGQTKSIWGPRVRWHYPVIYRVGSVTLCWGNVCELLVLFGKTWSVNPSSVTSHCHATSLWMDVFAVLTVKTTFADNNNNNDNNINLSARAKLKACSMD